MIKRLQESKARMNPVKHVMHQPLTTDRQKFYHLLSLVCEDLSTSVIDTMVRDHQHEASSNQLLAVRWGRKINLAWLIDMVKVGLPQFSIPAELLPTQQNTPLFQE
jgi:energy-converting hydrogenase A subunit M